MFSRDSFRFASGIKSTRSARRVVAKTFDFFVFFSNFFLDSPLAQRAAFQSILLRCFSLRFRLEGLRITLIEVDYLVLSKAGGIFFWADRKE
jgi:hypothetical protein